MHIFKRHNLGLIVATLLLAMAVVACRGETSPLTSPPPLTPSPIITSTQTFQSTPLPTGTITIPTPSPEAPCLSGGSIEERAREALANWLGVSSEEIEVIEVEEVEWPDTSLGCPQPGMAYAQVIVPGWRAVMRADDEVYEYHSGAGHGVLCDHQGNVTSIPPSPTVTPTIALDAPTPVSEDASDDCPMMFVAPHGRPCATPWMPPD